MVKRQPLTFDNDDLTKNLKESAGNGLDAFFSTNPLPVAPKVEKPKKVIKHESKHVSKQASLQASNQLITKEEKKTTKQESNISSKQASQLAILQFTDDEISELKEPAYKGQTYRLTDQEIEWLKDTAYRLNKVSKKTRVTQVDLVRLAFKLLLKLLESNEADLMAILQRIK